MIQPPAVLSKELAAASRILAAQGVVDAFGHVSSRDPHDPALFHMPRAMAPALVTPDDIVTYDRSGEAIDLGAPKGFLERYIHSEIYRARPDVGAVVHSHSPSVIPFGLVGTGMRSMFHNAAFVGTEVPVFDIRDGFGQTDMLVCDCDRGEALADVLGQANVVLMRAHGSVACGPTLEIAVFRAVYTEVNARIQHWTQALARDGEIAALEPAECELADATNSGAAARAWDLWRRAVRDECGW